LQPGIRDNAGAMTIPFAGDTLDRAGERRTQPEWIDAAVASPDARGIVLGRSGVLLDGVLDDEFDTWGPEQRTRPIGLARVPLDGRAHIAEPVAFLGVAGDGAPLFALEATDDDRLAELRLAASVLSPADAGLAAYAAALRSWHRSHRFCGRCGQPTHSGDAGHVRACASGHQVHPRTDPVVITLIVDNTADRVLLGRKAEWPERRYSALAGFVEPGETVEAAVAREVLEESGLTVTGIRYVTSQPWPFPASLMLGFEADYAGGEAHAADAELESVHWFSREELASAAREGDDSPVLLPPRLAIARHLIDAWLGVDGDPVL
jgi:NAD+ diphosphatase